MPDKVNESDFLPSSRSIAFKRSAWEKVKGYPEWLSTCEDLYFAREMKRKKLIFKFAKDAVVYWPQRDSFTEAFMQFFKYALGDGTARYLRRQTPLLFLRYVVGISLAALIIKYHSLNLVVLVLLLLLAYLIWAVLKNYRYVNSREAFLYLPLFQLMSDIAVLSGTTIGIIKSFSIKKS